MVWAATILFFILNLLAYHHAGSFFFYTDDGPRTPSPEQLSWKQKLWVLVRGIHVPKPMAHSRPESMGLSFQEMTVPGRELMMLSAWHLPQPDADTMVVLFHGYSSEKSGLLPEAKIFHEMGCEVLMVDFPGAGNSPGFKTTLGLLEAEDVASVTRWVRSKWSHRRVILYGHSMGGAAIMRAMALLSVNPDAAIVESVFDTLLNAIRRRFELLSAPSFPAAEILLFWGGIRLGANGFSHDVTAYAASVRTPVLVIHGDQDRRATIDGAGKVYDALAGERQFLLMKAAGHVNPCLADRETWKRDVASFISSFP